MKKEYHTHSPEETRQVAADLGKTFSSGGIIAVEGNLGAGKTVFVQGLARELGIERRIQSPTFVVMNVYPVRGRGMHTLVHVDCYRLDSVHHLISLGLEDYLHDPHALVIIEWADKITSLIPQKAVTVHLTSAGEHDRRVIISDHRRDAGQKKNTDR